MTVRVRSRLVSQEESEGTRDVIAEVTSATGKETIRTSKLLVATVRRPATADLHLDKVGVTVGTRGQIEVSGMLTHTKP